MYKLFLAIVLFADDICLLAPTCAALEKLIEMSANYCTNLGLTYAKEVKSNGIRYILKIEIRSLVASTYMPRRQQH